jgi:F0F1-type ATP synthase membrane subunit c/vacuolar-type H+-ATPase subunit K
MVLRIIWASLLMGQLIFLGVIVLALWPHATPIADEQILKTEFLIALIMLASAIPIGLVIRHFTFSKGRHPDGSVDQNSYSTGNIILWAMCEGCSFFGLVLMLQSVRGLPYAIVPAIAIGVQAITFPTGGPLQAVR